jgi:hypothetical protein
MARYFLDFIDGEACFPDDDGTDCADLEHARRSAIQTLAEIAMDEMMETGDTREFTVKVRDPGGEEMLIVSLSLRVAKPA